MTIAVVGTPVSATGANGATTGSYDTTGANLIVIALGMWSGHTPTVTDSNGNTYTASTLYGPTSGGARYVQFFYCESPTVGAGHTFTVSGTGLDCAFYVQAFSGAGSYDKINGSISAYSSAAVQFGSVTPANDNSIVISAVTAQGSPTWGTPTDTDTMTLEYTVASTANTTQFNVANEIQTTATAANPTWTPSASCYKVGANIVFAPAAGGGGITGTLSSTLGLLTLSSSGNLPITGTLSSTLGLLTLSATGTHGGIAGTLNSTLGLLSLSSTGKLAISGTSSSTLGLLTLSASAKLTIAGTLSSTIGLLTLSATGSHGASPIAGTLSSTLGLFTLSSTGKLAISGSVSSTLGLLTLASTGKLAISGTLSSTLGLLTLSASGASNIIIGTLSSTLGLLTLSSTGVHSTNTSLRSFPFSLPLSLVPKFNEPSNRYVYDYRGLADSILILASKITTRKGNTTSRPNLLPSDIGIMYFDTTLAAAGKPIFWTGTDWVDYSGTIV